MEYKNFHYKNEHALPFTTFVSRFKKDMYVFEKAQQPRNVCTQVEEFYSILNTDSALLTTRLDEIKGD